jgi:hypothetical protein
MHLNSIFIPVALIHKPPVKLLESQCHIEERNCKGSVIGETQQETEYLLSHKEVAACVQHCFVVQS